MDRGEDSGGEHGHRTRRVAGACTERRAERQRRGGARAGCRVAARALVGAAQRRACWVPRSGACAGCRAAARVLGAAQRRARWVPRSGAGRRTGHRGRIHEGTVCFSAKLEFIEKRN